MKYWSVISRFLDLNKMPISPYLVPLMLELLLTQPGPWL